MTMTTPRTMPRKKKNLHFTVELRRCLALFGTSIGFRTCSILICNASVEIKIKIPKIKPPPFMFSKVRRTWLFQVVLQRTAKKFTKIYNARAQPLFSSLNLLFCGILVAVAAMVCLRSLITATQN